MGIGRVMIAWNALHVMFFNVFRLLAFSGNHFLANRIWHTIQSDSTQRTMLKHVLDGLEPKPGRRRFESGLRWALKVTDMLSSDRNDLAHLSYVFYQEGNAIIPDYPAGRISAAQRAIERQGQRVDWRVLCGDLFALARYVMELEEGLYSENYTALPHRPRLRSPAAKTLASDRRRRRRVQRVRERRPKSSEG